ncbi:hypothetical protein EYC80_001372 [Monilinia laxa]|uniref:Uncharacterized protein n=1 Tax=Monilinia laxa TaxID=61186 RepID=A0A5N6K947_MONLA|nr:hypothetical protein EYC80_001372 [Monilinia laxa]
MISDTQEFDGMSKWDCDKLPLRATSLRLISSHKTYIMIETRECVIPYPPIMINVHTDAYIPSLPFSNPRSSNLYHNCQIRPVHLLVIHVWVVRYDSIGR